MMNRITLVLVFLFFLTKMIMCSFSESAPVILSVRPKQATVLAMGNIVFECSVQSFPRSQITWKKNNKKLSENHKKFRIIHGTNVSYLRVIDAGNFKMDITCLAENIIGRDEQTVVLNILPEREKPFFFPFSTISYPKSVEPDTLFKLECNVTNLNSPSAVQWYQSNRPITFGNGKYFSNFSIIKNNTIQHNLYVNGLSFPTDIYDSIEIDFLCSATNNYGTYSSETSVMIRNRLMVPSFVSPKRSLIELDYGSSINVTCNANGMPRPRVKWLEGRPETPIGLNVTTIYFNSIELEWKPGGISPINYYLIKYRKIDSEKKELEDNNIDLDYLTFNTTNTRAKIGNSLKPYNFYEFRLMAVNELGTSLPTDSLVVRTAAAKPGNVKSIRYTFQNENLYLIKCDEPDDVNGKLIHFVIYHTNQVTNPIRNWNTVRVPVHDMPYLLSINSRLASNEHGSYYLRISAVNQELGEGPFSQIVELKRFDKKFDPPYNFETLSINSTYALLKWNFNLDVLKSLYRQYNNLNINHESTTYRYSEENEITKNLMFEIYLKKDKFWPVIKAFRRVDALDLIRKIGLKRLLTKRNQNFLAYQLPFEYNMTGLEPNKSYALEIAARLYNVESQISQTLYFTTTVLNDHADKSVRVDSVGVVGKDAQSITLEWSAPSVIDAEWIGYKIKYSTDNLVYTPILLKNINLRKFRIDNLKANTEYKIQISAVNKNDLEGPATDLVIVKTLDAVPGEPQDFKVVKVTSRTIELEWKAPRREEQSSSNNIKGYEIHYYKVNTAGTGPSALFTDPKDTQVFKRKTNNVKKLKYTLTDLEPNSQYQIQIFAYNMKGDGQRSSPLMVTTLDEGPGKPENIRSEIYNDQLNIRWQAPTIKPNFVSYYVIHFNNERYEVNGQTNQISFPNSKWEYDRQYEFRIYAKTSVENVPNGAEAVFRISTQINQNKLTIQLEKLTSRSVLIKWNSVTLSKESPTYYKLEYSLKSEPNNVVSHDHLTDTELQLYNLRANSDYVVQLIAISMNNADLFSEPCIKHFRTLLTDIDVPLNLQVIRFEADKISIKWEMSNRHPNYKLFRIYFKELSPTMSSYGDLNYETESASNNEWRAFDQPIDQTELILEDLHTERDYAVKVLVVDQSDHEGPETPVRIARRLQQQHEDKNNVIDYSKQDSTASNEPREVEILEFTSTSVKFAWMPPEPSAHFKIDKFLISYVDRPKTYRQPNGSLATYHKGIVMSIRAPARDDPSIRITWLVNGLTPYTHYDFNISSILADGVTSRPVKKHVRTRVDKPAWVDAPKILQIYDDDTVRFENGNASHLHGPILKYWLAVVPLGAELQHDKHLADTGHHDQDLNSLLRYSLMNRTWSNESAYVAAEFEARHWPGEFILGDGNKFGRFTNRRLLRGYDYRAYIVAFSDGDNDDYDESSGRPNMLGLAQTLAKTIDPIDLFTRSHLSAVFNTRYALNSHYSSVKLVDYESVVWIGTALLLFVLVLVLISLAAFSLRKKRRAKLCDNVANDNATSSTIAALKHSQADTQVLMNNMGSYTVNTMRKQSNSRSSSSSSSSTTISPTTALLSCSSQHNTTPQVAHSQLVSTGLLTTASPAQVDSLYTSIEVTQKLLQQDFMNTFTAPSQRVNHCQLGLISEYDAAEYRRAHYPTASLLAHGPVELDSLAHHIETLKMNGNCKFSQEYESIEPGEQFTWQHSSLDLNRLKNRYANVVAYDHSRVVLTRLPSCHFNYSQSLDVNCSSLPPPPPLPPGSPQTNPVLQSNCSDYINANYIDSSRKKNAFIATQGPLPSTFGDFWRMIWEQHTSTVVMMTKLEERNRLKCDQYWPSKGSQIYDNCIQVTLLDQTELCAYTVRTFVLAPVGSYGQSQLTANSANADYETRRELKHFQFTAWPDHGVPEHPTQFMQFVRRVRASSPSDAGPLVVHCSAGVGRTGCFIVVDSMLERIGRQDKLIDIYGYVTCMRAQRNYMVQTEEQYVFCYEAVLEAYQSGAHTEVPSRILYSHLQRLLQTSGEESALTEMELEYKRLSSVRAPQSKFHSANLPSNKFKNRLVNILPYEASRVVLQTLATDGSDYINASFIDGYKYKRAYIATQAPLVETIDDFWRMLWEHNSSIVVMLTKLREMGREKCAQYWPNERSIRYQYFVVDPIAEYNMSQYVLREFKVTDARDGQSRTIRQFQFVDWPEQGVPKSAESIIELIGQVHKTKEQFGQTGPITVHCSAGVGRTGVFITLSIVLERMRFEGLVDVFNTVKVLRTQRSAMVQTEDQYQFCYRAALEYLGSFDSYE